MRQSGPEASKRCAIYTRVSTDNGLDQDFNSLDAQREACEAYIKSQVHDGWKLVTTRYNDGGFSGGSIDRPALKRLLADIEAKKIDIVVVYKVDRLTRSLADFAKLVELFDAHGVSFVSVTQAFNTTTSMGRLTLNVLLSFAQFEREVTTERIRDKIAASKKKGIWMGGVVPLGYRVEHRALHIVEEHALLIREIFRRYLEIGSVVQLQAAMDRNNVRIPIRVDGTGRSTGGGIFSRGHLYKILANPIYVGRICHKGQIHEGQHQAIVDHATWDATQNLRHEHEGATRRARQSTDALLLGKLFDDMGNAMSPTWTQKGSKRYRYYVSQAILQGRPADGGSVVRVSAPELERVLRTGVGDKVKGASGTRSPDTLGQIDRVTIERHQLRLSLVADGGGAGVDDPSQLDSHILIPWQRETFRRAGQVIVPTEASGPSRRPMRAEARTVLLDALGKAHRWLGELTENPVTSITAIAAREGRTERSVRMTLSLAFLSPDIVEAALESRLPRGFGIKRFVDRPPAWPDQWDSIGLQRPSR